jgi:hypothetical protein
MSTELQKRQAAEIAALPEWMREDKEALATNMDFSRDVTLPRLTICQSNTPQRKKDNDLYIKGLEEGQMFNSNTSFVYPDKVKFVVLAKWSENIKFIPNSNGQIECRSREGAGCTLNGGKGCCHNEWGPADEKNPKGKKPACTEFLNFVAFLPEFGDYVILSFKSTGLKIARQHIIGKLRAAQKGVADFAKVFEMTTRNERFTQGEAYIPVIRRPEANYGGLAQGELVTDKETYDKLKKQALQLNANGGARVKVHDESGLDAEEGATGVVQSVDGDDIPF